MLSYRFNSSKNTLNHDQKIKIKKLLILLTKDF